LMLAVEWQKTLVQGSVFPLVSTVQPARASLPGPHRASNHVGVEVID
jgi:hypothetical protein